MSVVLGVFLVGGAAVMALMLYLVFHDNLRELDRLAAGEVVLRPSQARDVAERAVLTSVGVVAIQVALGLWVLAFTLWKTIALLPRMVHRVWDTLGRRVLGMSPEAVRRIRHARRGSAGADGRSLLTLGLAVGSAALAYATWPSQKAVGVSSVVLAWWVALAVLAAYVPRLASVWRQHRSRCAGAWWQSEPLRVLVHTAAGSALTVSVWFGLVAAVPPALALLVDVTTEVAMWRVAGLENRIGPSLLRLVEEGHVGEEFAGSPISTVVREELRRHAVTADARAAGSRAAPMTRYWLVVFVPSWFVLSTVATAVRYGSDGQEARCA